MPARKGQPNLTNDPGKREGWQNRAVEGINKRYANFYLRAGTLWFSAVRRAARTRNMSASAYIRRAVAAFAAHDLGERMEDIVSDSPMVQWRMKDADNNRFATGHDDGQGYGPWDVK